MSAAAQTMAGTAAGRLSIVGLATGYRRQDVLRDVTLPALPLGGLVALLGPNAAGKSSFLKALAGQLRYRGSARFDGRELAALDAAGRARLVGYAPQAAPQPSALLAYELALSGLRAALPELDRAEADRRIGEIFLRLGLSGQAMQEVRTLSGGKRQLLGLAQILARRTPLLLLDEPTSALDLRWEIEVLACLRERVAAEGGLCLVALHDVNLALRFCDRVVLLAGGGLLAAGGTEIVTRDLLARAYGVAARVERCSEGRRFVIADRAV